MPRGDGTGPMGMGPMTGYGAGYCAGAVQLGYGSAGPGRQCGVAWRPGLGFGPRGTATRWGAKVVGTMASSLGAANPDAEKLWLKNKAEALQAELESVQRRLADRENSEPEK